MQAAEAVVENGLKGSGLTVRTRALLEILLAHGEMTVPEIALKLEINRQYIQVLVNETHAEDLTIKRDNPRHKRSTLIALTDKGRLIIKDVVQGEMALVETIGSELNSVDVEIALKLVTALNEKLKKISGGH
ncbi:MAG: helix-turn-helix domain-containing protein [Aliishimia sp.]